MEGLQSSVELGLRLFGKLDKMLKELLPDDLTPRLTFYDLQGEALECPPLICFVVGLLLVLRLVQSVRNRLYMRKEEQLANTLAECVKKKCQLINQFSDVKEEHARIDSALENAKQEKASNILSLVEAYRKIDGMPREDLGSLIQQVKEERSRWATRTEKVAKMIKLCKSFQDMSFITSQEPFVTQPGGQGPNHDGFALRREVGS